MKKGFSLVELSIVLVIIGILMGMVMKGKSLIHSAKILKEIHIMKKVGASYWQFYSIEGVKPPRIGALDSIYDYNYLIEKGYLQISDMRSNLGDWYYAPRYMHENQTPPFKGLLAATNGTYPDSQFHDVVGTIDTLNISSTTKGITRPWKDVCIMSNIVEQGKVATNEGYFRTSYVDNRPVIPADAFYNCSEAPTGFTDNTIYVLIDYTM